MSTAEQKIRDSIADPNGIIHFQHEGKDVVRWLTGGDARQAHVTFEHNGDEIIARCPTCKQEQGRFDAYYGTQSGQQLRDIRIRAHKHQTEQHQ